MHDKNFNIKCDECGKYISFNDLYEGKATHYLVTPDSSVSCERWESYCPRCLTKLQSDESGALGIECEFKENNEFINPSSVLNWWKTEIESKENDNE